MYIMSEDAKQIVNAEYPERFCIVEHSDASLVIASYRDDRPPVTMGRYADAAEARDALARLLAALGGGQAVFYMPESVLYCGERIKKDARVKRKGGS